VRKAVFISLLFVLMLLMSLSLTFAITAQGAPPANVNLVQNGDFALGVHNWAAFNAAMQVVNIGGANGNVMELARWAGTAYGGFYQFMPYPAPANGVFEFTFQLGNMSSTNRVINMLLRDANWQDVHSCFINLPPYAPLQNFTITLKTVRAWSNIVLQGWVYVGDYIGNPPLPFRLDNLDVRYRPSSSFSGTTQCPGAAIPASPTPSRTPTRTNTPTQTPSPAELVVTNLNDRGIGSLRAAVEYANTHATDDTITFAVSGVLTLDLQITILNNGVLTIEGGGSIHIVSNEYVRTRLFSVAAGATVYMNGLTIAGAGSGGGAGVQNNGNLTLTNSIISNNGSVSSGGGISNTGNLTIINSTIADNGASNTFGYGGGGIANIGGMLTTINTIFSNNFGWRTNGGAIANVGAGQATIINSLFTRNSAERQGGAIFNDASSAITIINSTFALNRADETGASVFNNGGTLTIRNTTLADNIGGGECVLIGGTAAVQNTLIEDGSCGVVNGVNGNRTGDPLLNPDFTLSSASPAVDAGNNALIPSGITTDLAGNPRIQGARVDMGAYERISPPMSLTPTWTPTATLNPGQLVVTNLNDSGSGSLRAAISYANTYPTNDTITFAVSGMITLTTGQLTIANNGTLTVQGADITLNGNHASRIFSISAGATVSLSQLNLVNGQGLGGGAISNAGTLTLSNMAITNNEAIGGSRGGGIRNSGSLSVLDSTIFDNSASSGGGIHNVANAELTINRTTISNNTTQYEAGGLVNDSGAAATLINSVLSGNYAAEYGGAIANAGTLTVTNSLLTFNTAAYRFSEGGAIMNRPGGRLTLTNSTLVGNTAVGGSGVSHGGVSASIQNSLIAGNAVGTDCYGVLATAIQHSLIEDASCGVVNGVNGNLTGDPLLNSDFTLSTSSPAIDAGSNALIPIGITTDLAGNPRIQGARVDMGAYELMSPPSSQTPTPTPTFAPNLLVVTNLNDSGAGSLRAAVSYANTQPSNDTITFTVSGTITLTTGQLNVANSGTLTIQGNSITVSGNNASRIFGVLPGGSLTLDGLIVTNGWAMGSGGAITNSGTLTLLNGSVTASHADGTPGGGGIFNLGALTITNTTFLNNSAFEGGAIYNEYSAQMTISGSTFQTNLAGIRGGAISNESSLLSTITDSILTNNTGSYGGAIMNGGSLSISDSLLANNTASPYYGGYGGAIYEGGTFALTISNTTITGNVATYGGAINFGYIYEVSNLSIHNSILAGNSADVECRAYPMPPLVEIANTLIEDGSCGVVNGVNGNLTGDPLLNPDFTLSSSSPAVDAGDNALIPSGVTTDLAGNPRIQGARVDLGAYESSYTAFALEITDTPSVTSTATATYSPTPSPTANMTPSPTPTATETTTDTPVPTPTPSASPTNTDTALPPTSTDTATPVPSDMASATPESPTYTPTETPQPTLTYTETPTSTVTETATP